MLLNPNLEYRNWSVTDTLWCRQLGDYPYTTKWSDRVLFRFQQIHFKTRKGWNLNKVVTI